MDFNSTINNIWWSCLLFNFAHLTNGIFSLGSNHRIRKRASVYWSNHMRRNFEFLS